MKATALYRTASILLVVAAAGNTYAVVKFFQIAGAMSQVPFPQAHGLSYTSVVVALGVFCSLCVLFGACLAWHLGALARTSPQAIGVLGWVLFAYQLLGVFVSFNALSGVVRMLTVALAICTGWAAWASSGSRSASLALN